MYKTAKRAALINAACLLVTAMCAAPALARDVAAPEMSAVVPIDWKRFGNKPPSSQDYADCSAIVNAAGRYNAAWIVSKFHEDPTAHMYTVTGIGEQAIRPGASAVYGMAVLLKTGAFDEKEVGVSREVATTRAVELIKGLAATHRANGQPKGWGDQWQSAVWAALLGHAGWLLWDDMDVDGREMLRKVVEHEADRFIAPGYHVPYWTAPDDHVVTPGDTKAEENAWNSDILQVAVAMMPNHPHVEAWKRICSELMISSYAYKTDLVGNTTVVDGKPVKDWLNGYNVRDDGAIINHNILHPDYMATPTENLRSYLVQPLAGQTVSQTAPFNADRVYRTLVEHVWASPPYKAPGGTIYLPGSAEVYYPMGTDWSRFRFDIYYLYDTFAATLHWDGGLAEKARGWMHVRAQRMLAMQARGTDGSMYVKAERPSVYPNDQMVAWQMGDALLLQWLDAQGAIRPTGNWLAK